MNTRVNLSCNEDPPLSGNECQPFAILDSNSNETQWSITRSTKGPPRHKGEPTGWCTTTGTSSTEGLAKASTISPSRKSPPGRSTSRTGANCNDQSPTSLTAEVPVVPVANIGELPSVTEEAVIDTLQARLDSSLPYTRAGNVLIAVNPFQVR